MGRKFKWDYKQVDAMLGDGFAPREIAKVANIPESTIWQRRAFLLTGKKRVFEKGKLRSLTAAAQEVVDAFDKYISGCDNPLAATQGELATRVYALRQLLQAQAGEQQAGQPEPQEAQVEVPYSESSATESASQ